MYKRAIVAKDDAKIEDLIRKTRDDSNRQHQEYLAKMDAKMDADQIRAEARLAADRKEAEARLVADRKEAADRLAADQKRAEARLEADRREAEARQRAAEARLAQERAESEKRLRSHTRWLVATFFTAFITMIGIFASLLISNGYLPF